MTLLLIVQYKSPASALVNIGPGGEGTSVFAGAMGKHRPPGTFSFISGTACLYPMVTAMWFSLYFLQKASLPLLALSGMAIFLACPVSISRFLVVGVVLVVLAGFVGLLRSGMVNPGRIIGGAAIFMLIIGLSTLHPEFREASEAFGSRWNNSTSERGGVQRALVGRVLDTVTKPLAKGFEIPIFGHGIGLGTQVGAIYASGARSFELGEEEFPRVMSELGPVLGLAMMILRFVLAWNIGVQCLRTSLAGQSIPLVFGAAAIPMILYGLWGQATQLGAFAITTGLVLAWLKQAGVRSC
ncbi:MAG: hypothetical protein Q7Q71_00735 [Verrucomicrobiota bacterium JB023]|nr:hypothetical protein [Verrucomicrobiota bacterium JB023]